MSSMVYLDPFMLRKLSTILDLSFSDGMLFVPVVFHISSFLALF